jgi:hypothetical protein
MPTHPVKRKLEQAILPYVVSAEKLKRQPAYVTYDVYSYAHELLIAVVALGVAPPLLSLFASDAGSSGNPSTVSSALDALKKAPPWLAVISVVALAIWLLLKLFISRENVAKRAVLARSCRKEMRQLSLNLRDELQSANPMPGLQGIQEAISELVHRHIQEESWPWDGPSDNIDRPLRERLDRLCHQFEQNWLPVPDVDQI